MKSYAVVNEDHGFFDIFDSGADTLYVCTTCNAAHIFRDAYFARTWANQHATGRHETLVGVVGS